MGVVWRSAHHSGTESQRSTLNASWRRSATLSFYWSLVNDSVESWLPTLLIITHQTHLTLLKAVHKHLGTSRGTHILYVSYMSTHVPPSPPRPRPRRCRRRRRRAAVAAPCLNCLVAVVDLGLAVVALVVVVVVLLLLLGLALVVVVAVVVRQ